MNPHTKNSQATPPTVASTWQAVAGIPLTDQILEWPADLFAVTNAILERSEVYRFALSPGGGLEWPPGRFPSWSEAVEEAGRQWSVWVEDRQGPPPRLLAEEWSALREREEMPLEHLAQGLDSRMCEALLTLHAIADEACAGLGIPLETSDGAACVYRARARELLARTGSLARIPTHLLRVLPKVSTALNGSSLRSFSRYACVHGPGVEVRWHKLPLRRVGTDPGARHANLLLLPWPLRVRESDFRPLQGSVQRLAKEPFGLFEFAPSEKLDLNLVGSMLDASRDEVDSVDCVMLPESAVDENDIDDLEAMLDRHGVGLLVTGVRQRLPQPGRLPGNWVHIGVNPRLEKGGRLPESPGEGWFHIRQNKHHRWSLDEGQILQYHLGGALHPHIRWWEATDVPRRTVHFLELGDQVALACLVCEDLAQIDNVVEVIRSVGPNGVLTPLLDGPQLSSRWAARYASVLADDPGSTVLTLTSFGMVQRSRPRGRDSSPVVALWKDPVRGLREIKLEAGAQGVLLTLCGSRAARRSADGRYPVDNATEYFDVAVHQVRASSAGTRPSNSKPETLAPRPLKLNELTILTGWVQALVEAIAYSPESIEIVLDNARAGAPWRAELGIAEPSQSLRDAMGFIGGAVCCSGDPPTLDELHAWCRRDEDRLGENGLERLVRRVLRSTLEPLRTRQAHETGRPGLPSSNTMALRSANGNKAAAVQPARR
jgi:hypothetical protein